MTKNEDHPDPPPEARARGYEVGDVRLRWALVAVAAFIVFAAATHVWLYFLWLHDADDTRQADIPRSVLTGTLPPSAVPPLQPTQWHDRLPAEDLLILHRRENEIFAALGWKVAEGTTVARPPEELIRIVESRRQSIRGAQ